MSPKISRSPGAITVSEDPVGNSWSWIVAKKLGRKSICIDQNPKACKIMEGRLA